MAQRARGRPRGGGSTLQRSEIITIRLSPQLRYLAELCSRVQRRTLSSFVEWSIAKALECVVLDEGTAQEATVAEAGVVLWDPLEPDRFALLGFHNPELFTFEEALLWKLVRECPWLWRGASQNDGRWEIRATFENLRIERLRDGWEIFKQVAAGEKDKAELALLFGDEVQQPAGSVAPKVAAHAANTRRRTQREPGEQHADNHIPS